MTIKDIVLWDHEGYYCPPATKKFRVKWGGDLVSATFYLDLDPVLGIPGNIGCLTNLAINGHTVAFDPGGSSCNVMVFDCTPYLTQGLNEVSFDYWAYPDCIAFAQGIAVGVMEVEATGSVQEEAEYGWLMTLGYVAVGSVLIIAFLETARKWKK
mgnify:CR=1 FL=1